MKTIILSMALICCSALVFGQDKIEGLGRFKILRSTVKIVDSIAAEYKFNIKAINSTSEQYSESNKQDIILLLLTNPVKTYLSPAKSHYCENAISYLFPKFKIGDVFIKDLYLTFYDNVLVDINFDYDIEVIDILTAKYGQPELDEKKTETKCEMVISGREIKHVDSMLYQGWRNGNISATACIGKYRDDKCEAKILSYCNISADGFISKISSCDSEAKVKVKKQAEEEKLNKLKEKTKDF